MAKRNPRPQRPPRQCLFCESLAGSPEHIWPNWMRGYFPRTSHDRHIEMWDTFGLTDGVVPDARIHHRHTSQMKVKAVCKTCNTGWMSRLETATKPMLKPMSEGRRTELSEVEQRTLADWIALKMMVLEVAEHEPLAGVFTREQTLEFAATRKLPDRFEVWLLKAADQERRARVSRSFAALFGLRGPLGIPNKANAQTVLLRVGRLVIFAVHSEVPLPKVRRPRQTYGKPIWPTTQRVREWPPLNTVDGPQIDMIARTLNQYVESLGRRRS